MSADNGVKPQKLTDREVDEVEELVRPRAAMLYEVVRKEGDRELSRTFNALWWSGLAAGLSLGFSPLLQAVLAVNMPAETGAAALVVPAGYCVGFLIVVLARQQLFTENTITAVLPLMADKTWENLHRMLRLWLIVLVANLFGTILFAAFVVFTDALNQETMAALLDVSRHMVEKDLGELLFGAVFAGWLIAAMVWLMPSCEGLDFWIVLFFTYIIALLEASHIIAGSVEATVLYFSGAPELQHLIFGFLLPTLVGNVVGGTALFTLIAYAQVREEVTA